MSKKTARKNRAAAPQREVSGREGVLPSPAAGGNHKDRAGGEASKIRGLWLLAGVLIFSGYALLHKVDPAGQNSWAILAPALLLSGYLLIIPAIVFTYRR